ncbi:MAG TPA: LPS assembly protein LptD [candidate division Zixibacteria bacterium]|nr:LPS assembly protein LptD [candidate division Zixibacteria bacterium]
MRSRWTILTRAAATAAVLFLGPGTATAAQAERKTSQGEAIQVTADQLSVGDSGTQVEARGNVEIKREQTTLKAEEVRVNRATQEVEAKGKISVDDPEWKVKSADSIQINLEKETGEILRGDLFIEQGHVSLMGRRFQKFGGQTYHVDEGFFTTCLCESGPPHWRISADAIDLDPTGLGTVKNAYFYVLDVPVFYLPYGFFPVKTERQTGLLFPRFGHSSTEGFRFQQPFFWAISKSTDATLAFDVQTRARWGFLGEFRTLFRQDADLRLSGAYFNEGLRRFEHEAVVDRTIADQDIPQNRWSIAGTHRYLLPRDWLTYSDFAAYGDDLFTRELVERMDVPLVQESEIRRSRFSRSRFGVFRSWGDAHFQGEWDFYQDFIQNDASTLHRTPQVSFWGRRFFRGLPLELRWGAEGVNYIRRRGGDGLRFDLRPELVLPFRTTRLFGSFSVAPRETLYHLYSIVDSGRNLSRELVEIRGNVGTTLGRTFAWTFGTLRSVRHVVEPELGYLFVPRVDQKSIPVMDGLDRVNRRNAVTFAVGNRLLGRFTNPLALAGEKNVETLNPIMATDIREIGSARFAITYDIDKERKRGDTLSDLDMNFRLTPANYFSLGLDAGLDPGAWKVNQLRVNFGISDPRPMTRRVADPDFVRPNSFGISYHFLRQEHNAFLAEDPNIDLNEAANCAVHPLDPRCPGALVNKKIVGNINVNLLYHLLDHVLLFASGAYDARDSRFLGFRVATKLLSFCECWNITLGVRKDINPSKTSFNFDFNLLGLGGSQRPSLQ